MSICLRERNLFINVISENRRPAKTGDGTIYNAFRTQVVFIQFICHKSYKHEHYRVTYLIPLYIWKHENK